MLPKRIEDEVVQYCLRTERPDSGANTIGHQHEETLGGSADGWVCLLIHKQGTADVEKVKRNTINDAREDEQPDARTRIA